MISPHSPLGKKPSTQSALRMAVFEAARLLESRLDSPPAVQELARAAGLSVFHFHRAFRSVVGETVAQHSLRVRLERAAAFLKFFSRQLIEITLVRGFATPASFTRAFTRLYGMSPQRFRKNHAVMPFLRSPMRCRPDLEQTPPCWYRSLGSCRPHRCRHGCAKSFTGRFS
jgi:AraC family transcriptional regulator